MEIQLTYFDGLVQNENISNVQSSFNESGLELSLYDRSGKIEMSLEQMVSQIFLTFGPALINTIAAGLVTNVMYDAIKSSVLIFSEDVKGKKYNRHYTGGRKKELDADFGIKFKAGDNGFDLKISPNLDSALQEKCIKEAFNIIKSQGPQKELSPEYMMNTKDYIGHFNETTGKWELIEFNDLILKKREDGTL